MNAAQNLPRLFGTVLGMLYLLSVNSQALAQDQETVEALKDRIIDIQNEGTLGFKNFILCRNVGGFGEYVPYPDNKVKAGSEIYFYYEPVNVFTNRAQGNYQIWFTQDIIIQTLDGQAILNLPEKLKFRFQAHSPVMDLYAQNSVTLGQLPPGKYKFVAVLHDKLKKANARKAFIFEIVN